MVLGVVWNGKSIHIVEAQFYQLLNGFTFQRLIDFIVLPCLIDDVWLALDMPRCHQFCH